MSKKTASSPYLDRKLLLALGALFILVSIPLTVVLSLKRPSFAPQAATAPLQVSSGNDDAYQLFGGQLDRTGAWVRMDCDPSGNFSADGGFRFTNVTIPPGSTINSASLQVYVRGTDYDDPNVDIFGNKALDANDFATEQDIIHRSRTNASVGWVATGIGSGPKSLDIKNVVQEIINQPGWASGKHLAVLVYSRGCSSYKAFWVSSIEGGSPATLTISYTTPTPAPTANIKANNSDGPITIGYNSPATISWSSTNATSCSVSPTGWSGTSNLGISTGNLTSGKTYTLSCSGAGGSASDSVTVNVSPASGGGTSGGGSSGGKKSSGGGAAAKYVETLQMQVSVPYLAGKMNLKMEVSGVKKELEISGDKKGYSLDLKDANLALNKEYSLVITSDKTLVKKVKFTPTAASTNLNIGDLVLGDLNQDNKIDSKDQLELTDSITEQTALGDLNADKDTDSLDWAILLTNFGKRGD